MYLRRDRLSSSMSELIGGLADVKWRAQCITNIATVKWSAFCEIGKLYIFLRLITQVSIFCLILPKALLLSTKNWKTKCPCLILFQHNVHTHTPKASLTTLSSWESSTKNGEFGPNFPTIKLWLNGVPPYICSAENVASWLDRSMRLTAVLHTAPLWPHSQRLFQI